MPAAASAASMATEAGRRGHRTRATAAPAAPPPRWTPGRAGRRDALAGSRRPSAGATVPEPGTARRSSGARAPGRWQRRRERFGGARAAAPRLLGRYVGGVRDLDRIRAGERRLLRTERSRRFRRAIRQRPRRRRQRDCRRRRTGRPWPRRSGRPRRICRRPWRIRRARRVRRTGRTRRTRQSDSRQRVSEHGLVGARHGAVRAQQASRPSNRTISSSGSARRSAARS